MAQMVSTPSLHVHKRRVQGVPLTCKHGRQINAVHQRIRHESHIRMVKGQAHQEGCQSKQAELKCVSACSFAQAQFRSAIEKMPGRFCQTLTCFHAPSHWLPLCCRQEKHKQRQEQLQRQQQEMAQQHKDKKAKKQRKKKRKEKKERRAAKLANRQ